MLTRDEIGRRTARELGAGTVVDPITGGRVPASAIRPEPAVVALRGIPQLRVADAGTGPVPATEGGRV